MIRREGDTPTPERITRCKSAFIRGRPTLAFCVRRGSALAAWAFAVIAACSGPAAAAQDRAFDEILDPDWVTDRVGYWYGSLEDRTPLNRGLNANLGFVVTDAGTVLIDTRPSVRAATDIANAVESATGRPVAPPTLTKPAGTPATIWPH